MWFIVSKRGMLGTTVLKVFRCRVGTHNMGDRRRRDSQRGEMKYVYREEREMVKMRTHKIRRLVLSFLLQQVISISKYTYISRCVV